MANTRLQQINNLAREIREEGEKWNDAQKRARVHLDAQTKEESFGLGDAVEAVTKATGIKAVVDYVFDKMGKDCGCDARKERLNDLFSVSYATPPECFTESELEQYKAFKAGFNGLNLTSANQRFISELWAAKFRKTIYYPCSTCPSSVPVFLKWINELDKLAESYE